MSVDINKVKKELKITEDEIKKTKKSLPDFLDEHFLSDPDKAIWALKKTVKIYQIRKKNRKGYIEEHQLAIDEIHAELYKELEKLGVAKIPECTSENIRSYRDAVRSIEHIRELENHLCFLRWQEKSGMSIPDGFDQLKKEIIEKRSYKDLQNQISILSTEAEVQIADFSKRKSEKGKELDKERAALKDLKEEIASQVNQLFEASKSSSAIQKCIDTIGDKPVIMLALEEANEVMYQEKLKYENLRLMEEQYNESIAKMCEDIRGYSASECELKYQMAAINRAVRYIDVMEAE